VWGQSFPATWARVRPRSPPAAARQETIRSILYSRCSPCLGASACPSSPPPGAGASGGYKTFAPTPTRSPTQLLLLFHRRLFRPLAFVACDRTRFENGGGRLEERSVLNRKKDEHGSFFFF